MSSRDRMLKGAQEGESDITVADHSDKIILSRGCDPVMAERAGKMLSPMLGNVKFVAATTDVDFIALLQERRYNIVMFAPGACRFNAAKQPIPGGNDSTKGWGFEQYRDLVRQHQGEGIRIVESTEEAHMVPLLNEVLKAVDSDKEL